MDVMLNSDVLAEEILRFQGDWQQTYCEANGIANPPSEYGNEPSLSIIGNTFVVTHSDGSISIKGLFTLDPMQEPKVIDWSDTFGTDAGKTFLAIYRFEADRLIFCAADEGQARPKEFHAHEGQVLRVHQRVMSKVDTGNS